MSLRLIQYKSPAGFKNEGYSTGEKKFRKPLDGFLQKIQSPNSKPANLYLADHNIFHANKSIDEYHAGREIPAHIC
jgi:hypothetical protein